MNLKFGKMRKQRKASLAGLGWLLTIVATSGGATAAFAEDAYRDAEGLNAFKFPALLAENFADTPAPMAEKVQAADVKPATDAKVTGDSKVAGDVNQAIDAKAPKLLLKPGQPISVGMETQDIVVTDDVELAKEQVAAFPESPEASFILAVALTRTSMVEQALKEVRRARKLAQAQGGAAYFDKMISTYEDMVKNYPDDNRVRYGLAWAYYMKAYVLAKSAKTPAAPLPPPTFGSTGKPPEIAATPATGAQVNLPNAQTPAAPTTATQPTGAAPDNLQNQIAKGIVSTTLGVKMPTNGMPQLERVMQDAPEAVRPQVRMYYQAALKNLDDLLARNPNDVWARVYRAFLNAEYTGDVDQAMVVWKDCQAKFPDNPAPYFFLGEGYLKQGNLKECLQNISKAIALRAIGK